MQSFQRISNANLYVHGRPCSCSEMSYRHDPSGTGHRKAIMLWMLISTSNNVHEPEGRTSSTSQISPPQPAFICTPTSQVHEGHGKMTAIRRKSWRLSSDGMRSSKSSHVSYLGTSERMPSCDGHSQETQTNSVSIYTTAHTRMQGVQHVVRHQ